jgi:hypothetical protein
MSREIHVQFCEGLGVRFPRATHLNMVEIEISVLSRQCLGQWIPGREKVKEETRAWERERNRKRTKVYWQFTIPDARVKLKRFYPS